MSIFIYFITTFYSPIIDIIERATSTIPGAQALQGDITNIQIVDALGKNGEPTYYVTIAWVDRNNVLDVCSGKITFNS